MPYSTSVNSFTRSMSAAVLLPSKLDESFIECRGDSRGIAMSGTRRPDDFLEPLRGFVWRKASPERQVFPIGFQNSVGIEAMVFELSAHTCDDFLPSRADQWLERPLDVRPRTVDVCEPVFLREVPRS